MRSTSLNIDKKTGKVELQATTIVDVAPQARLRNELGRGFTKGRSLRAVADIPLEFLQSRAQNGDIDAVVLVTGEADPRMKQRALRGFLKRYPAFRISDGNI